MEKHLIEYIIENSNKKRKESTLLIGLTAEEELRQLCTSIALGGDNYLLEITENETQFWNNLLWAVAGNDWKGKEFDRQTALDYTEIHLKKRKMSQHLFLPNVGEMFYKYDVLGGGLMNASLRRLWSDRRTNLAIIGSVRNTSSESYKKTFAEYTFPFYIENWATIKLK
jgi:hypothetical protein